MFPEMKQNINTRVEWRKQNANSLESTTINSQPVIKARRKVSKSRLLSMSFANRIETPYLMIADLV